MTKTHTACTHLEQLALEGDLLNVDEIKDYNLGENVLCQHKLHGTTVGKRERESRCKDSGAEQK